MTCPICNHVLQQNESFCPECGFEIHIVPEENAAIQEYEKNRKENYKAIWESLKEGQGIRGFIVVGMDEETLEGKIQRKIKDVFPIYMGKNVIGKMPEKNKNDEIHRNRILFGDGLQNEQLVIEVTTDNEFSIQNISGTSYLRNKSNTILERTELFDNDEIFIGNIILTFIQK